MILTENQEETDRYWNAIVGNGGEESRAAGARIKLGLLLADHAACCSTRRTTLDALPRSRAMEAMMTMKKIDIATIEAARAGAKADK